MLEEAKILSERKKCEQHEQNLFLYWRQTHVYFWYVCNDTDIRPVFIVFSYFKIIMFSSLKFY